jgi:hypothetical protein
MGRPLPGPATRGLRGVCHSALFIAAISGFVARLFAYRHVIAMFLQHYWRISVAQKISRDIGCSMNK